MKVRIPRQNFQDLFVPAPHRYGIFMSKTGMILKRSTAFLLALLFCLTFCGIAQAEEDEGYEEQEEYEETGAFTPGVEYPYDEEMWAAYLDEKIKTIPEGKSFIFVTDVHWNNNVKHSTKVIEYIRNKTGITKVLFGGDVNRGKEGLKTNAIASYGRYLNEAKSAFGSDFLPCIGDHDYNLNNPGMNEQNMGDYFLSYSAMRELFMGELQGVYHCYAPAERLREFCDGDQFDEVMDFFSTVYYVDDDDNGIRYISLNCGKATGFGAVYDVFGVCGTDVLRLQFDFLAETLMSTPEGYDIVVLSHKAGYNSSGISTTVVKILSGFKRKLAKCYPHPSSAKGKVADKWWPNTTKYNFSEAPDVGKVICVEGHYHYDKIFWFGRNSDGDWMKKQLYDGISVLDQRNAGQIPVIETQTDAVGSAYNKEISYLMTPETVTEQCIDIITLTDDGVHITRIGAGEDRDILIGD